MKEPKAPRLVTIAIITTTTIIFWVFFDLYRVFTTTPPVNVPAELMVPITPTLDIHSLENIENRIYLSEEEIPEILVSNPLPELSPTPTPEATESAEISVATESAEIPTPTPTETLLETP